MLDYFASEIKKIQGLRNTSIVLTKDQENTVKNHTNHKNKQNKKYQFGKTAFGTFLIQLE